MSRRGCSPRSRRCSAATDPRVETPPCCVYWNLRILKDVGRLLDARGIRWWADYGTLLGYMTGRKFYWNDKDTDICLMEQDRALVLEKVAPALKRIGLRVTYRPPQSGFVWGDAMKVRLSQTNKTNCDLTFWHTREDRMLDRTSYAKGDVHKGRAMPESWVLPTTRGVLSGLKVDAQPAEPESWVMPTTRGLFSGVEINVPAEPELLIAHRYGENWRNLPAVYTDGVERHDHQPEMATA